MEEETKKRIWEEFKDKLIKEGINSPEEINFQVNIPNEKELLRGGTIIKKIGQLGKFVILLVKKAVWLGGAIVIVATLPESIDKIRIRYPKVFEEVDTIHNAIISYNKDPQSNNGWISVNKNNYKGQYVVFNPNWVNNRIKFTEDIKVLDDTGNISDDSIIAPATGVNEIAIIHSDLSVSESDFT